MILSFDRGDKVIAVINGGQWDKKKIKIYEPKEEIKEEQSSSEDEEEEVQEPPKQPQQPPQEFYREEILFDEYNPDITYENPEDVLGLINDDYYRQQQKYISLDQIEDVRQHLLRNEQPKDKKLSNVYTRVKKELKQRSNTELYVPDGFITPYMNPKSSRYFIAGSTGSGKSTFAANLIKQYKRQFPTNRVILFSRIIDDPVLVKIRGIKRVLLDESFIEDPPDAVKEFKDSLVIFDDIDTLKPKQLKDAVLHIREDILQVCRKYNTTLISTEHQLMNYKQTRNLINDSEFITFFPKSGSHYHIMRFLKVYAGLNKKEIEKVLSLNSRAITLHKAFPQYILSDHNVYLLNG